MRFRNKVVLVTGASKGGIDALTRAMSIDPASDASRNICGERLVVDAGCSAQHMPVDVDM